MYREQERGRGGTRDTQLTCLKSARGKAWNRRDNRENGGIQSRLNPRARACGNIFLTRIFNFPDRFAPLKIIRAFLPLLSLSRYRDSSTPHRFPKPASCLASKDKSLSRATNIFTRVCVYRFRKRRNVRLFKRLLYRGRKRVIIEVEKGEAEEITGPSETTSTKIPTEIPEHGEIGRRSDRIIPRVGPWPVNRPAPMTGMTRKFCR